MSDLPRYTSEPEVLFIVKLTANIIVAVIINLDVYFCLQSVNFKNWWGESELRYARS
jgi:hypothetical protein